jgi:hypothetical protein
MEFTHVDGDDYAQTVVCNVAEAFESMTEGERCHMANKLYKEGYVALKATQAIAEAAKAPVGPEQRFKVGDAVRSIGDGSAAASYTFDPIVGTVVEINAHGNYMVVVPNGTPEATDGYPYCYYASELEAVI